MRVKLLLHAAWLSCALAVLLASAPVQAEIPVNVGEWGLSAGLELPIESINLVIPGLGGLGTTSPALTPFLSPEAAVSLERRLRGDVWLLLLATDQFNETTSNGLPQSTNGSTMNTDSTSVENILSAAVGIRQGVAHLDRVTFSWFGMVGGGWSYEAAYTYASTVTTPALTQVSTTGHKQTFLNNESILALTASAGIVVDVALAPNLSVRASTPVFGADWNTVKSRVLLTDGTALGSISTSSQVDAGLAFAPTLQLRLTF